MHLSSAPVFLHSCNQVVTPLFFIFYFQNVYSNCSDTMIIEKMKAPDMNGSGAFKSIFVL